MLTEECHGCAGTGVVGDDREQCLECEGLGYVLVNPPVLVGHIWHSCHKTHPGRTYSEKTRWLLCDCEGCTQNRKELKLLVTEHYVHPIMTQGRDIIKVECSSKYIFDMLRASFSNEQVMVSIKLTNGNSLQPDVQHQGRVRAVERSDERAAIGSFSRLSSASRHS